MTRKDLLINDGYWKAAIEIKLYYKNFKGKKRRKELIDFILKMKNELIKTIKDEPKSKKHI